MCPRPASWSAVSRIPEVAQVQDIVKDVSASQTKDSNSDILVICNFIAAITNTDPFENLQADIYRMRLSEFRSITRTCTVRTSQSKGPLLLKLLRPILQGKLVEMLQKWLNEVGKVTLLDLFIWWWFIL